MVPRARPWWFPTSGPRRVPALRPSGRWSRRSAPSMRRPRDVQPCGRPRWTRTVRHSKRGKAALNKQRERLEQDRSALSDQEMDYLARSENWRIVSRPWPTVRPGWRSGKRAILAREINAEAGFIAQRTASLAALEQAAVSLRDQLAETERSIAAERAAWLRDRQAESERLRSEIAAAAMTASRAWRSGRRSCKRRAAVWLNGSAGWNGPRRRSARSAPISPSTSAAHGARGRGIPTQTTVGAG